MTEPLGIEDLYKTIEDERSCGEGFKEERTEEAKKLEISAERELHQKVTMMENTLRQHEGTIDALRLKIENLEWLIESLQQASRHGVNYLAFACKRESTVMPGFSHNISTPITDGSINIPVHKPSQDILNCLNITTQGVPYSSSEDGNCLFSSASIALIGDASLTTELRVRTCVEMVNNREHYMTLPNYRDILLHSPDYADSCLDCAKPGSYSSQWTVYALSSAISCAISVLYPPVNAPSDHTHHALSAEVQPMSSSKGTISILWTNCSGMIYNKTWSANHFVPLLPKSLTPPSKMHVLQSPPLSSGMSSPPLPPPPSSFTLCQEQELSVETGMPSPPLPPPPSPLCQEIDLSMETGMPSPPLPPPPSPFRLSKENLNNTTLTTSCISPPPPYLPPSFTMWHESLNNASTMSTPPPGKKSKCEPHASSQEHPREMELSTSTPKSKDQNSSSLTIPHCSPVSVSDDITQFRELECSENEADQVNEIKVLEGAVPLPSGSPLSSWDIYLLVRSNDYVVDYVPLGSKSNVFFKVDNESNADSPRNVFYDDCGVWSSSAAKSVKTVHIVSQNLKQVFLRNGQYCVQRRKNGVNKSIPLSPQPDQSDIVILHRYYAFLKRDPKYKRRISWFSTTLENSTISNIAIYEYVGEYTAVESEYQRTHPETMKVMGEEVNKERRAQDIYRECVEKNNSILAPRDTKQVQNIKYRQKKSDKPSSQTKRNIADDVLDIISMVNDHPYIQQVVHTKGTVPSIICYTDDQITDLRHFVTAKGGKLGVDRTFHLGSFFVTTIVYKNIKVVRKDNKDHPIFLGPLYLHKEATYPVYREFFSHISSVLECNVHAIDIRLPEVIELGSDDKKALTKAIDRSFPGSMRSLCTKHLKDNIEHYMKDIAAVDPKDRKEIKDKIFGDSGLVNSNDTFEFEERAQQVLDITSNEKFRYYFRNQIKEKVKNYVLNSSESHGKNSHWTNNNSESINNVLKMAVNWKPQKTLDLIEKLFSVVKLQFLDLRRALYNSGNYKLSTNFSKYHVPIHMWHQKTELEKCKVFRNFLKDSKQSSNKNGITSADGKFTIPLKSKDIAKKPGQRKRPRNVRTRTPHD